MRRENRLVPDLCPLTPELPAPLMPMTLSKKLAIARSQMETERRRHAHEVNALVKYNGLLEEIIRGMREAFEGLGKELVPLPWDRKENK